MPHLPGITEESQGNPGLSAAVCHDINFDDFQCMMYLLLCSPINPLQGVFLVDEKHCPN
jgi:hypothetical protein